MNEQLTKIYRSCRAKEALASQDEYKSANVLLGTEVERFAELIVQECLEILNVKEYSYQNGDLAEKIKQHFGVDE